MAIKITDDQYYSSIANAIRNKGVNGTFKPSEMADGINDIATNKTMEAYLADTLERFRTMVDYRAQIESIKPGSVNASEAKQAIIYWEMPNNTAEMPVWGFSRLRNMIRIDAGLTPKIRNVSVAYNDNLRQVILRKSDTITTLEYENALSGHADMLIYVPANLIETYKTASNWSTKSTRFRELYIASDVAEKEEMLNDPTIPNESMIVCDVDQSYTVKGETQ